MSVKHLRNHVVQTDEDYQIKSCDKTILAIAPVSDGTSPQGVTTIRLRLPHHARRGHKLTVVASDVDVIVFPPEGI